MSRLKTTGSPAETTAGKASERENQESERMEGLLPFVGQELPAAKEDSFSGLPRVIRPLVSRTPPGCPKPRRPAARTPGLLGDTIGIPRHSGL